jgi:hypothetical protein
VAYHIVAADMAVAAVPGHMVVVDMVAAAVAGHILAHMVVGCVPSVAAVVAHMVAAHRVVARMDPGVAHMLADLDRSS